MVLESKGSEWIIHQLGEVRITGLGYKRFKSGFDLTELRVSNRQLETIALINTQ